MEQDDKLKQTLAEAKQYLMESKIDDFFNFLEKDPKKNTIAYVYYTNLVKVNKTFLNDKGEKQSNPMDGKLYKNTMFSFRFGDTYSRAVERDNPEHEMGKRSGTFDKIEGYSVVESGKNGLYLPILPLGSKATYSINDNGNWKVVDKEEIRKYLPPSKPSAPASGVAFRLLKLDNIYMLRGGGNEWVNPNFQLKYSGAGATGSEPTEGMEPSAEE